MYYPCFENKQSEVHCRLESKSNVCTSEKILTKDFSDVRDKRRKMKYGHLKKEIKIDRGLKHLLAEVVNCAGS